VMTDTSLAHVLKLLDRIPMIDGHNDLPIVIRHRSGGDVRAFDLAKVHAGYDTDIPRLKQGRVAAQFWAAYVPTAAPHSARFTLEQIDTAREIALAYPETFRAATRSSDVMRAKREGRIAAFVTVESTVGLEGSLAPLRIWHAAGVRLVTLCHNETLPWVDSATDKPASNGLSDFGRALVRELNRLGIIIDLAHVAPHAMHQVLDETAAPVVWSHSNAARLCDHPRNVPDDVLARVKANGGLVMVTFVPDFVSQATRDWHKPIADPYGKLRGPTPEGEAAERALTAKSGPKPRATLEQLADHVDYLVKHVGIDHVGIGSDFFGGPTPVGLEDVSRFPHFLAELHRRGYSDAALTKIAGGNLLRVFRRVEAVERAKRGTLPERAHA
jgi:membrane dipeptidase